ncbi:unnamed protein product [Trichogramma brassicae]|uniref:CCHC-type domain-containing protein n=1 Tax=Trichogramma brassicae TaxID=86971 RepID=A0A6H5IPG3_9HYME|nr:unnamed protein product [Trichogramma brassicae]
MECCRRRRFRRRPSNQLDNQRKFAGPLFPLPDTPGNRAAYCPRVTCQICGQQGHNKKVCPNSPPQQSHVNQDEPQKQCVGCHAQGVLLWTCPKCAPVLQALGNGLAGPLAGQQQSPIPGVTNRSEHHIRVNTSTPVRHHLRRMSPKMEEVARAEVTKLAAEGFIEQSASDWCSAPGACKETRRGVTGSASTIETSTRLRCRTSIRFPIWTGYSTSYGRARYLSKVDLKNAYHQIPMEANSKKYTAFAIPGSGLWHYTRMPFGLCNAPRTFQRLIDSLFGPEFEPNIFGYLDDIIVATDTFEEHLQWLEVVLSKLREAGLSVNRKKSDVSMDSTMSDEGQSGQPEICKCYMPDQSGLNQDEARAESPPTSATDGTADSAARMVEDLAWQAETDEWWEAQLRAPQPEPQALTGESTGVEDLIAWLTTGSTPEWPNPKPVPHNDASG